jgi:hypothetical protein
VPTPFVEPEDKERSPATVATEPGRKVRGDGGLGLMIVGRRLGEALGERLGTNEGHRLGLTLTLTLGDVLRLMFGGVVGVALGEELIMGSLSPEIWRMRLFERSPTNANEPSGEMQIPPGLLNLAFEPTPFVEPADEPARVLTEAVETMICRIKWLPKSVTKAEEPSLEKLTQEGPLNLTSVPAPFVEPETDPPASVVTDAVEMTIWRMRLLNRSATRANTPLGEMLIPSGR